MLIKSINPYRTHAENPMESVGFGTTRHQGLFYDLDTCQKIEEKLNKDKVVVSLTEHTNSSQYMQVILVQDNRQCMALIPQYFTLRVVPITYMIIPRQLPALLHFSCLEVMI